MRITDIALSDDGYYLTIDGVEATYSCVEQEAIEAGITCELCSKGVEHDDSGNMSRQVYATMNDDDGPATAYLPQTLCSDCIKRKIAPIRLPGE